MTVAEETRPLTPVHFIALCGFSVTTILLIPLEWYLSGLAVWALTAWILVRSGDPVLQRNLGILLVAVLILGFAPIHTNLDTLHFFTLGIPFLAVVVGPYLYMRRRAPGELVWRFWPRSWAWRDVIYTLISVPLAWGIIQIYFFHLNPELPTHWPIAPEHNAGDVTRLAIGINCVGIWDELFFINTVYVLLRRVFPARWANLAQAVVYTSVLYHMAFTGWGIVIVCLFALTQGVMYEKSSVLLYVLIVHLIVDLFLVLAILQYHAPHITPPML